MSLSKVVGMRVTAGGIATTSLEWTACRGAAPAPAEPDRSPT